jgi:hypothetical protein
VVIENDNRLCSVKAYLRIKSDKVPSPGYAFCFYYIYFVVLVGFNFYLYFYYDQLMLFSNMSKMKNFFTKGAYSKYAF